MTSIPKGWGWAPVRQLIANDGIFSDGDWVESKDQDPNGSIRLLQLADVGDGKFLDKSARYVNEEQFVRLRCTEVFCGDVLIARMPDPLGRACLVPQLTQRCVTVVDVAIARPGNDSVVPAWLMHFLNAPVARAGIAQQSSGTTRRRISRSKLAEICLPIPPLREQRRIADKLDSLLARVDACRERLDRVPAILRRFRQSVLASATGGELIKGLGGRWETIQFGEVLAEGPKNGLYHPSSSYGTGTRILRIDNFYEGFTRPWTELKRLRISDDERTEFALMVGDIVINRVNSLSHLGKSALIREIPEDCVFESNMMRVRVNRSLILPEYAILALTSPGGIGELQKNAKNAVNQASINQTDIRNVRLQLPPMNEQAAVVERVAALMKLTDALASRVDQGMAHVAAMTPALLAKAFRGELVSQDPNDEPASELLARIRREKQQSEENGPHQALKRSQKPKRPRSG